MALLWTRILCYAMNPNITKKNRICAVRKLLLYNCIILLFYILNKIFIILYNYKLSLAQFNSEVTEFLKEGKKKTIFYTYCFYVYTW